MRILESSSIASLLLLLWTQSSAAIDVCGAVLDETWSIADSPVMVTCDLRIAELKIDPGVEVHVAGDYDIVVNGILRVLGTRESPVVFKSAAGNALGWAGIYFEDTIDGSAFLWTRIEGSNHSGLHLVRSYPTLDYVTFRGNSGPNGGGLLAELSDRNLRLNNCLFADNHADTAGGAIRAVGPTGPDDAVLEVSECVFRQNSAGTTDDTRHNTRGGAIDVQGHSRISRSTFLWNEAQAYTIYAYGGRYTRGGAVYAGGGRTEIIATTFLANACRQGAHYQTPDASREYGGAVYQASGELLIRNCIVAENVLAGGRWPDRRGGGVCVGGGVCSIVNTSLAENSHHAVYRIEGDITILNSILFNNNDGGEQISDSSDTLIATFSDVQQGFDGEGNIGFDPIFDEYFRIVSPSPVIDAGHPGSEYYDASSLGLGELRNDMGATGGPLADFAPTADAGPDQDVDEQTTVTLDGTRSINFDGGAFSYWWHQIAGPLVTLSSATAVQPTFWAADVTELTKLTFQLVLRGQDGDSAPVTVNINVRRVPVVPTADAGPDQNVDEGMPVTLDGTGSSDLDGDPLSYAWRQTAGPDVALSDSSEAQPTFMAPSVAELTELTFELTVNNGHNDSLSDTVSVAVHDRGCLPEASADCDDDDPCTEDLCTGRLCVSVPIVCDDADLCTTDACDPTNGSCKNEVVACADNQVCVPSTGECVPCIADSDCDDENPCTDDTCNEASGCVFTPDDTNPCGDADTCNGRDVCEGGNCVSGPALDCDDGKPCTDDTCNPATGCVFTPNDALPCADDDFCNGLEACETGECAAGSPPCTAEEACDEEAEVCFVPCLSPDDCQESQSCVDERCVWSLLVWAAPSEGAPVPSAEEFYLPGTIIEIFVPDSVIEFDVFAGWNGDVRDDQLLANPLILEMDSSKTVSAVFEAGPCSQDSDCDDGEHCNGAETCVEGTCQLGNAPCAASETCNEDDDCCEVRTPGMCGSGAWVCVLIGSLGWLGLRLCGVGHRGVCRSNVSSGAPGCL